MSKIQALKTIFHQSFESPKEVAKAGGVISGSPVFRPGDGIILDGSSDYISYNIPNTLLAQKKISFVVVFLSDFNWDDGLAHYLYDSTSSNQYTLVKHNTANSNGLVILLGTAFIGAISPVTYSAYWKQNERNIIAVSSNGVLTNVWLNGSQIMTNDNTAWSVKYPTEFYIGATNTATNKFIGTIKSFSIHSRLFTQLDVDGIQSNSLFNFENKADIWLDMKAQVGEPTTNDLLVDGNAEAGDVSAWTAAAGDATKETGTPYQGAQVLRLTDSGGFTFTIHYQSVATNGVTFRAVGQARSDGTSLPYVATNDAGTVIWTGTNSTDWQSFDVEFSSVGTTLTVGGNTMPLNGYVEFDVLELLEEIVEQTTKDKSSNGNHFLLGDGSTTTTFPSFNGSGGGFDLDGSSDYLLNNNASGIYGNASQSIVFCFSPDFAAGDGVSHILFDSTNGGRYTAQKNSGVNSFIITLGNTIIVSILIADYKEYWRVNGNNVLVVASESANTDVFLNGVKILDSDNTAWTAKDPTEIYLGAYTTPTSSMFDGQIFHFSAFPFKLSPIMAEQITSELMGVYNG